MTESVSLKMSLQAADQLCRTKRVGSKVNLDLEGRLIPVQIKEKKKNHLGTEIEHISFQALAADQWVSSVAHIFLKNTDLVPGVLEQMIFEVPFSSLPADRKFSEYTQAQRFDLFEMQRGRVKTLDKELGTLVFSIDLMKKLNHAEVLDGFYTLDGIEYLREII